MLFNSYFFIFLFLPLCLAGYYLLARWGKGTPAKLWLVGFSLWFYGYFNPAYLAIMVCSILMNYAVFRLIAACPDEKRTERRALMIAGVACNLGVLFYFKYYDFFLENINGIFHTSFVLKGILLPLGISFFTFQQIGFVVDAFRGEIKKCSLLNYALFVSFFPQLIAGPIVSQEEMLPQLAEAGQKRFDPERFASGIYLFALGMTKKVLVADTFGSAVDWGYSNVASLSSVDVLLLIPFYALQLYFDFSGYCNMARGLAWMFGIDIPVNFNSPYKAVNIIEFWRRWHITLSRFFTRYVYIPLGGNRKGRGRMYFNLLFIFFLSGIWHGADWTFVVWSMAQGILYVITRAVHLWKKDRRAGTAPVTQDQTGARTGENRPGLVPEKKTGPARVACSFGIFLFFSLTCVFFRADHITQAMDIFRRLFTGGAALPAEALTSAFNLDELWYIIKILRLDALPCSSLYLCAAITLGSIATVLLAPNADECAARFRPTLKTALLTAALLLWTTLSLSGVSSFLYFNF